MTEGVGVDMGKPVAAGEVIKPAGDAVRVHVFPAVRGKHIPAVYPAVTVGDLKPELFPLMLSQKLHGFPGQLQVADIACFGGPFINALALGGDQCTVNFDTAVFKVHLVPLQAHDFPTAASGDDHQVRNELPFQWLGFQGCEDGGDGFRLEIVWIFPLRPGWCGFRSRIVGDKHFLLRLGEDGRDQAVMLQDGFL